MRFKSTYILTFILILLGAYVYYIDIPQTEKKKREKELKEKVIPFEKEELTEFTISYDDTNITISRDKAKVWQMLNPVKAKADTRESEGIVSRLNAVTFSRIVDENPNDLKKYGLETPKLTITATIKGEKKKILVGDRTPMDNGVYVKRGWDKKIFLSGTYIRDDLKKSVYAMRDKTLLTLSDKDIKEISVVKSGEEIVLKKVEKSWQILKPVKAKADDDVIDGFINKIGDLKASEFIDDDPDDIGKYRLDKPEARVEFLQGDKKYSLIIGKKRDKKGYFAKTGEEQKVVLLNTDDVLKIMEKTLFSWRDKHVMPIKEDRIDRIALAYPDEKVVLKLGSDKGEEKKWKIIEPERLAANERAVSRLINSLLELEVKRFVTEKERKSRAGVYLSITLFDGEEKMVGDLTVSDKYSDEADYFASSRSIGSALLIGKDDVKDISKRLYDLRDRRLVYIDEEKVKKITIKYPEKEITVEKKGGKWKILTPERRLADEVKVRVFLWDIRDIEFTKILEKGTKTYKDFGFDNPKTIIRLWEDGSPDPSEIIIGKRDKDAFYAKTGSSEKIYVVEKDIPLKIPKGMDEFL